MTFEEEIEALIAKYSTNLDAKGDVARKLAEVAAATDYDHRRAVRAKEGLDALAAIEAEIAAAQQK